MSQPTIISAAIEYGDATVRIEPFVLVIDGKQIQAEVIVDCPEYSVPGREYVMVVGAPLKKDGTPAAREVKPTVRIERLPANVREALIAARA